MTKTTVKHTGKASTFTCSLTSWNLHEDLIRLYCSGREVIYKSSGKRVDNVIEQDLHLYQIKPKKDKVGGDSK